VPAIRVAGCEPCPRRIERCGLELRGRGACGRRFGGGSPELRRPLAEGCGIRAVGPAGRGLDQRRADGEGDADVVRCFAMRKLDAPGLEGVHPRHHRVTVATRQWRRELGNPHIVAQRGHLHLVNLLTRVGLPAQSDTQRVVSIGEAMRLDSHAVAGEPLDRKASRIDRWKHGVDDRAYAPVSRCSRCRRCG
jgi:hypothetical protein